MRVDALESDLHPPAARRELNGIREQVPDNLLKPHGVAGNGDDARVHDLLQAHAFGFGGRADGLDRRLDERVGVNLSDIYSEFAGDDARDVKEVVDELSLRPRVALDRLEG